MNKIQYYAKIDGGIVVRVIACSGNTTKPGYVAVSEGSIVGIGWTYDGESFIPPEPQEVEDEID